MNRTDGILQSQPSAGCDSGSGAVTVLMPVYNGERFLKEQVASVLMQDRPDLYLQVIDDGSTDDSFAILTDLASHDERVRIWRHEQNVGLIVTIGELLASVTTPYFALADQDDIWDRDKVSRSLEALCLRDASLVYSDVRLVDEEGLPLNSSYLHGRRLRAIEGSDPVPFVFENPAIGHTLVGTREVAQAAAAIPHFLLFHEAWIIAAACEVGAVAYVGRVLGSYRWHSANVIGPKATSRMERLYRAITNRAAIVRRQRTRTAAITAIAQRRPGLIPIARSMQACGFRRIRAVGNFSRFMLSYLDILGPAIVVREVAFFLLVGFIGDRSRDLIPPVLSRTTRAESEGDSVC